MSLLGRDAFIRYLDAKTTVDDRALNARVWSRLLEHLAGETPVRPRKVLELGAGIGTMAERLRDTGALAKARYTLLDQDVACLWEARTRLGPGIQAEGREFAGSHSPDLMPLAFEDLIFEFKPADAVAALQQAARQGTRWDLIIAHAFLDLVDLAPSLQAIRAALEPGGLLYATINFDGLTVFEPQSDPGFEKILLAGYHGTMDKRRVAGQPSGHSQTGRRLFDRLQAQGGEILEAGGSDWVVWPGPRGYPADEAFFLHYLVDTIDSAVQGLPGLPPEKLARWTAQRHEQIERAELFFMAHQLDFLCRFPARGQ